MGCLPDEAAEKSVNGGLRYDPCRCRFADHSQPPKKQTRIRAALKGSTPRPICPPPSLGKVHPPPWPPWPRKSARSTINVPITASQFHGRGDQQASPPTIAAAGAVNVAGKVSPQAIDRLSAGVEFDFHPCQRIGNVAIKRKQEERALVTESSVKATTRELRRTKKLR